MKNRSLPSSTLLPSLHITNQACSAEEDETTSYVTVPSVSIPTERAQTMSWHVIDSQPANNIGHGLSNWKVFFVLFLQLSAVQIWGFFAFLFNIIVNWIFLDFGWLVGQNKLIEDITLALGTMWCACFIIFWPFYGLNS